ncbi:hypothetical protein FAK_29550 [Desulfoferula mesophila]|uniref:Methyltransferase domain-containing protein n=2 Tax=Desulfoferula mesophila TaxID=3058419 RepID=A0AAU9EMV4_9BACT|nr:hypothetical protein FAK_29550 [Desulfoferula mesophilus]
MGLADIQAALDEFHASLDEPYRMTPAGMWACSQSEEVYDLLRRMDLGRYRSFADVGSGDGRAVLIASLFMPATGIEADPALVEAGRSIARRLGLNQANFLCDDCRRVDLAAYDLLFIYPDKPLDWLVARLPEDWAGNLLVYGAYFQPPELAHIDTIQAGHSKCTLWER